MIFSSCALKPSEDAVLFTTHRMEPPNLSLIEPVVVHVPLLVEIAPLSFLKCDHTWAAPQAWPLQRSPLFLAASPCLGRRCLQHWCCCLSKTVFVCQAQMAAAENIDRETIERKCAYACQHQASQTTTDPASFTETTSEETFTAPNSLPLSLHSFSSLRHN